MPSLLMKLAKLPDTKFLVNVLISSIKYFSSFLAITDTMCDTAGSDFMRFSHTYHSRAKITHIHFSPLNIFKKGRGNKFMTPQTFIQKYLEISWT